MNSNHNSMIQRKFSRTFDEIYLCPAPNFQGGNQIMDLRTVQFITRPKVVEIPITDIFINAVGKISEERGFKSLKIYDQKKK